MGGGLIAGDSQRKVLSEAVNREPERDPSRLREQDYTRNE